MKRLLLFVALITFFSVVCFAQDVRPTILASDVVFMYSADPASQYDDYQGTVVGWGGRPRSRSEGDVNGFKRRVDEAHKRGMRYCGSVDFLVDFGGYIDFAPDRFIEAVCRDLDGEPLQVPWLHDHKHKGNPAYWFCFNNPDYQKYLLDQAERVCLAPVDGLHIDDYAGTSHCSEFNGGCFCPYCMKGFREYLSKTLSKDDLKNCGVENINKFSYKDDLISNGFSAEDFKRSRKNDPLRRYFQDFQNEQMKKRIAAVYEHAEKIRCVPLVRSVNSSASSPRTVIPSPIIDYFCGEIHHNAKSQRVSNEPAFVYRMVETLGDRQTATASGQDWAWIKANDKPGLVRAWIAQTYAFGSVFMVPHHQWCYTQELGTHWWHGEVKDFAFLYRFVRENAERLDGYQSLAKLALLCTNPDFNAVKRIAAELTESNIPFDLIYSADPSIRPQVSKHYDAFIVSPQVQTKAEWLKNEDVQVVSWKDVSSLPSTIQQFVRVEGSKDIHVSLRYNPQSADAPFVCHLLNQKYSFKSDSIEPVSTKVSISQALLTYRKKFTKAIVHEPQKEIRSVEIDSSDSDFSFSVDELGLWAIVELK